MLTIDGSQGEGGGQILRTALALAMITATPLRIDNIRAKRRKPGLLRQHLTCVKAATEISGAATSGAELGSTRLTFESGQIRGGTYDFAIGSAGSTSLVFQTILPALLEADGPSMVTLSGGTHNPMAPSYDYLDQVFLPLLERMGATVTRKLHRPGFYPAGGGKWHAKIHPTGLTPLVLEAAGPLKARRITADVANIPFDVAEREAATAVHLLSWSPDTAQPRTLKADGHGNVVAIALDYEHVCELFTGLGERGLSAEAVAAKVVDEVRSYLGAKAPVGPHLADQLLLPLALAGSGSFITSALTEHARTNIAVIEKFLAIEFSVEPLDDQRWRVSVAG